MGEWKTMQSAPKGGIGDDEMGQITMTGYVALGIWAILLSELISYMDGMP